MKALSVIFGLAVLLGGCGGAVPAASNSSPPGAASAAVKPASTSATGAASSEAKPSVAASAVGSPKPGAAAPATAALSGPAGVAARYPDLISRGDASGVPALFTDDAVFIGDPPCNITTFCKGPADIAKRVEAAAAVHGKQTIIGTPSVAGNQVFLRFEARSDVNQKAGVDRRIALATAIVQGEKIAAWATTPDLGDPETLKFQLYNVQQAQASASAAASVAAKPDPAGVPQRFNDAINRGDDKAAAAVFADNAVNIAGNCPLQAPCTTPAAILKQVQGAIGQQNKLTRVGDIIVAGNVAQQRFEVRNDITPKAGVERVIVLDTWTVEGDKAVGRLVMDDVSDLQTQKYGAYKQAQADMAKPAAPAAAKPRAS